MIPVALPINTVTDVCYALYQIDWTARNLASRTKLEIIVKYYKTQKNNGIIMDFNDFMQHEVIDKAVMEHRGWRTYDDFLKNEYLDDQYMRLLIQDNEIFLEYIKARKTLIC